MNVPFHLRRLPAALPATAVLVLGRDTARVLEVVARLGLPLPQIHTVADGFLIRRASQPFDFHPPGCLRLRERAPHLLLPVDADLVPGLLDDEARALVRNRGLVFLPGDRVLAYDPTEPLSLADLVATAPVRRAGWRELPPGSRLIERIRVLLDERPPPTLETIFEAVAGDLGQEAPPRPPAAPSTTAAVTGQVQSGLGRFLHWAGNALNWRWLAQQGANLIQAGRRNNPRTAEQVHGEQQAALQELLRQLRDGDREEALRRALPIGGSTGRGDTTGGGSQLPTHNLRFSLNDLLGGGGQRADLWVTPDQLAYQLAEEYRRAARDAMQAGDFRRAAFIYGKLLSDYRSAAQMLARAGLHREAAVLFLDRVGDEWAAASCFAEAGDFDRAVQLYRKRGAHVEAGDVLRRAGDEEAALVDYQQAADKLVQQGRHHEAGDLMRDHVRRPDLALGYFRAGWERRPSASATHCLTRLLGLLAQEKNRTGLLAVAREAGRFYRGEGAESEAVRVLHQLVELADPLGEAEREELRDLALLGLAARLRDHAQTDTRPRDTVSALFGRQSVWPASFLADAEFALRGQLRQRGPRPTTTPTHIVCPLGHRGVTAVAGSANGEMLYIGFEDGHVVRFRPALSTARAVERDGPREPIQSLATDSLGLRLLVLTRAGLESVGSNGNGRLGRLALLPEGRTTEESVLLRLAPLWHSEATGLHSPGVQPRRG